MAKSKSFFGLRRGSTKSLTFSVLNGQQVTKDRVYGGKNPRSLAQMNQRLCMATASAAYADMKQIVDHSFEGISYGANSMARFLSLNVKALKENITATNSKFGYNDYGNRGIRQGAYIMSRGTALAPKGTNMVAIESNRVKVGVFAGVTEGGNTTITANGFIENTGVGVGEMLTAVFIAPKSGKDENFFGFCRFKVLKAGDVALTAENYSEYIQIETNLPIQTPAFSTTGNTAGSIVVTFQEPAEANMTPNAGFIHSALVNGSWTRSNCDLDYSNSEEYTNSYEDAIATYPVGESYVLNGGEIE